MDPVPLKRAVPMLGVTPSSQLRPPKESVPLSLLSVTAEAGQDPRRASHLLFCPPTKKSLAAAAVCVFTREQVHGGTYLWIKYCVVVFVVDNDYRKQELHLDTMMSMLVDLRASWIQHRKLQTLKAAPGKKTGRKQLVSAFLKKGRQWDIGETALKLEQILFYKWALSTKLLMTNVAKRKAAEKHFRLTSTARKCWGMQQKTLWLTLTGPSKRQIQEGKLWKLCTCMQTGVWKKAKIY